MSDIVERLRTRDAYLSLDEAADALEALSARLAEAEALLREARKQLGWYWAQCLYDGFSPLEDRLSVNMKDIDAFLSPDSAEAVIPPATQRFVDAWNKRAKALHQPSSASEYKTGEVCEACGGTGKAYLLHSRAERPCPMCQPDQP